MELDSLLISAIVTQPLTSVRADGREVIVLGVRDESGTPMFLKFAPDTARVLTKRLTRHMGDETA